jgi:hypothetical protein
VNLLDWRIEAVKTELFVEKQEPVELEHGRHILIPEVTASASSDLHFLK